MSNVISDDVLAGLRAEASKAGSGDWVRLGEKGDWVSGVVVSREITEAPFGEVEELMLTHVRTHEGDHDPDQQVSFRLSRSVLKKEFGEDADDGGAKVGMLIFCECNGQRTSKAGKAYWSYNCTKMNPKDADKAAKDNAGAAKPKRKAADVVGDMKEQFNATEEPPF